MDLLSLSLALALAIYLKADAYTLQLRISIQLGFLIFHCCCIERALEIENFMYAQNHKFSVFFSRRIKAEPLVIVCTNRKYEKIKTKSLEAKNDTTQIVCHNNSLSVFCWHWYIIPTRTDFLDRLIWYVAICTMHVTFLHFVC